MFHNMNKTSFENLGLIYPGKETARAFSHMVSNLHDRMLLNECA